MSTCAHCGADFSCAMRDGGNTANTDACWCTELPPLRLDQMPARTNDGALSCLCPTCLRRWIATRSEGTPGTIS